MSKDERLGHNGNMMAGFQIAVERICKVVRSEIFLSVEENTACLAVIDMRGRWKLNRMDQVV